MQYLKANNIILVLLIILGLNEIYKRVFPTDTITPRDLARELMLQKSQIKIDSWEDERRNQKTIYETLQKNINIDSVIVWDADRKTRDSIRASINPS